MSFVLYGAPNDGPHVVEVPAETADATAASVGGTVHDTIDACLTAWHRDVLHDVEDPEPEAAEPPAGPAPATEVGSGDPTFGTQTPTESSPSADQS